MIRLTRPRCICRRSKRRKVFVIVMAKRKTATNANPLHHLQIPGGIGLIVSNSNPIMQRPSGRIELVSKAAAGAYRWATIRESIRAEKQRPPAKPASATAICAAVPRASPGSIVRSVHRVGISGLFLVCSHLYATNLLFFCANENLQ
jgi:hypothetical protein